MAKSAAVIIIASLGTATTALAHAVLIETTPHVKAALAGPEVVFRLRFNSRIDGARSALKLVLPDGKVRSVTLSRQISPDTLSSHIADMKSGRYTLRWQVLAADGHITRGEIPFEVR